MRKKLLAYCVSVTTQRSAPICGKIVPKVGQTAAVAEGISVNWQIRRLGKSLYLWVLVVMVAALGHLAAQKLSVPNSSCSVKLSAAFDHDYSFTLVEVGDADRAFQAISFTGAVVDKGTIHLQLRQPKWRDRS